MARLNDMTGEQIHEIKVIKRAEDYDGSSDTRVQCLCECSICYKMFVEVARNLVRYKSKYKKGCRVCSGWNKKKEHNVNGFLV